MGSSGASLLGGDYLLLARRQTGAGRVSILFLLPLKTLLRLRPRTQIVTGIGQQLPTGRRIEWGWLARPLCATKCDSMQCNATHRNHLPANKCAPITSNRLTTIISRPLSFKLPPLDP